MTRHTRAPYRIHSGFWTTAVCLALLAPVGLAQADDQPSGKHVGNNKHVGKPSPRVLAADLNRPRPLTLATSPMRMPRRPREATTRSIFPGLIAS